MWTSIFVRIPFSLVGRVLSASVVAAGISISAATPVATGSEIYTGDPISIELADAGLDDVLTAFSEATDHVFAVDAQTVAHGGLDQFITVDYEAIPWDQALDEILTACGLKWTLEGKVLWIHLPAYSPSGDRNFTGDAINLRLEDAKLADVLRSLAKVTGVGIDFDPDIETTVSVALRSVPWDQVLDLILRISGFEYTHEGDSIEVFKVTDTKGLQLINAPGLTAEEKSS